MTRFRSKVIRNTFFKNALVLSSGTAIGQALLFLTYPIITRMYTPEHFGELAAFVALLSIVSTVSCLRYEVAIPLPKEEKAAISVTLLSLIILFLISVLMVIPALFLASENKYRFLWFLPVALFFLGVYQIFSYYSVRQKQFISLSITKITQSTSSVIVQILMAFSSMKSVGLIIGEIVGRMSGSGTLIYSFLKRNIKNLNEVKIEDIKKVLIKYKKFPLISSFSSLINSAGSNITPMIIIYFYGVSTAGYFALSQKVIAAPIVLLGNSVSQVYYSEVSDMLNKGKYLEIYKLFFKTSLRLFVIGIIPAGTLVLIGPKLFSFVFGHEWRVSGQFVQALSLMFLFQFVVVPLSQTMYVFEKQKQLLAWDCFRFLIVVLGLYFSHYFQLDSIYMVLVYSLLMSVSYIVMYVMLISIVRKMKCEDTEGENG